MKKALALILAATMLLTAMVGCGGNSNPAPGPGTDAPGSSEPDPDAAAKYEVTEPVTIEFWHAVEEQYRSVLEEIVADFQTKNPNIKVDVLYQGSYADINEKFLAANTAGGSEMPSLLVVTAPAMTAYAANGILEPLDAYITDTQFPIDEFATGMVEAYTRDGEQYGLPFLNSAYVWFYNKTITDAEGIEMPKTWDEIDGFMQKAAKPTLASDGFPERYAAAFGGWDAFYFESLLWNNGVKMVNDDGVTTGINSPVAVEMSEQFQKWCDANQAKWSYGKGASGDMRQAFLDGKIVSVMHTCSLYGTYQKADFELGMIFPPKGTEKGISEIGGCSLGIPSSIDQAKKNAAWQLMKFLTEPENNMKMVEITGYLPTRPSTIESDLGKAYLEKNPALADLYANLDNIYPQINNLALDDMLTKWETHLAKAINEKGNMKEELAAAEIEINEILADQ